MFTSFSNPLCINARFKGIMSPSSKEKAYLTMSKNYRRSFSFYIVRKKDGALSFQSNPMGRILIFLYCVFQIFGRLLLFVLVGYYFQNFHSILVGLFVSPEWASFSFQLVGRCRRYDFTLQTNNPWNVSR